MAEERLGASFSIDVTDLKAGLAQANRLIKESESEFKAAAAGMDKWSDSEDGLNAKIKSLSQITEVQRTKVDALKDEYKRLIDDGMEPTSKQAVELRTKINNEEAALKKNEAELKKQTKALEELADGSQDAGKEIKQTGEQAKESAEGFTIAKGAIANLISNGLTALVSACKNAVSELLSLPEATREYSEGLNQLETAFGRVGYTAEETYEAFNYFGSVLGDTRKAQETMLMLAQLTEGEKDLTEWTDILTGVYSMYGKALPTESLTEAILHTAQLGEVQGTLADALEWAGIKVDDFNVELKKHTDMQDRAAYIQQVLNGVYMDAADTYNILNKDILDASTASTDLENAQSKLGDQMRPTTTAITQMKTEFIEGLTPAIKENVIPALNDIFDDLKKDKTVEKFSGEISSLAKKVLPVVSSGLKFLAENLETIIKVGGAAITVFTTFKAVMAVSTAISAARTAIAGLSAATSVATAVQTGFNAAMAANPIGAIATAIALLTVGIIALTSAEKKEVEVTDVLSETHRNAVTAIEEEAQAYRDAKAAAEEKGAADVANIDYTKNLIGELQTLVNENGEVKAGYEARANFILNELAAAYGDEYGNLQAIIDQNGQVKQSIYDVIEARKAEIMLQAYEESYREAVAQVGSAYQERAIHAQGLAAAEAEYKAAQDEVARAQEYVNKSIEAGGGTFQYYNSFLTEALEKEEARRKSLEEEQAAYDQAQANIDEYTTMISGYEDAQTAFINGQNDVAQSILNNLGTGFQTAASTAQMSAEEQQRILGQQVIDTEVNLKLMEEEYDKRSKNMTETEKTQAEERIKNARKQAEDAKTEFQKVGGDITKGIAEGAESESWILNNAMENLIDDALEAARRRADSHSPSRLFRRKLGITLPQGIAVGIDDGTKDVIKSVRNQVAAIQDAYSLDGVANNVEIGASARNSNSAAGSTGHTTAGGVVVNQYNTYSQAHSRYELYKSKQQTEAAVRLALGV